jgi:4-hydroxybenzoate polyprenyltransferase
MNSRADGFTRSRPGLRERPARRQVNRTLIHLLDYSHASHALLSVAQPALGALLAAQGFPNRRTTSLGVMAAGAGMLCVYASNDLFDLEADREEARWLTPTEGEEGHGLGRARLRHPLAQGALPVWLGVSWVVGTGVTALALATELRRGCGLMFVSCVGLEALYSALKRRTWLKTLPGGAMVGLGALSGWYAVRDLGAGSFSFFLLLSFWEIFGRNVSNDLADLSLDTPIGIRTIATTYGPEWAARTCLGGATAVLLVAAMQKGSVSLRLLLVAIAAWTMTIPALRLVRKPTETEAQRYFDRASLFPPLAFLAAGAVFLCRAARTQK